MMMSGNPNVVFTAAQWEELEQQALIYKYMVSGVPVPTDLILSVRRSLYNSSSSSFSSSSSSSSSSLSYNHPTFGGGWEGGYPYNHQLYQIGGGRKIDLEPGRCRRTDGKKWRCSKEAFPDSKYCERHMHRGRNRSRKPVEFSSSSSSSSSSSAAVTVSVSSSPSTTISKSISHSADAYPSPFSSIHTNFITSSAYSNQTLKDYRQLQQLGVKELGEDERSTFFQTDPFNTIPKMQSGQHHHFSFQNLKDQHKVEETQGQHCFVMGTDFIKPSEETSTKSAATQMDTKLVDQTTTKQPFHHFFSPPKTTMNPNQDPKWVEVDHHNHQLINPPKAPLSTQDLFQSKPRPCW